MVADLKAMERHLPCGITQRCCHPNQGKRALP